MKHGQRRAADYFGLERNVVVVSAVVFLLGFGEELWKRYLPKYLEALGAGVGVVGLFGTAKDFFDAIYRYPGGWLADRWGGAGHSSPSSGSPRPDTSSPDRRPTRLRARWFEAA